MLLDDRSYLLNGIEVLVTGRVHSVCSSAETFLRSLVETEVRCPQLILDVEGKPNYVSHVDALTLAWRKEGEKKPINYQLDYASNITLLKSLPAPKQGAFNQALGKKTKAVLDVTGGWGGDALLMAAQGYRVHIMERNQLMALLLQDAFERLARFVAASDLPLIVPTVSCADSILSVSQYVDGIDCAYLDPMFPPKRKKSAAANKQMQLLQWLIGEDVDAEELISSVAASGVKRIAVKRPSYASPLLKNPAQQFSSKLVHYDVYLNS